MWCFRNSGNLNVHMLGRHPIAPNACANNSPATLIPTIESAKLGPPCNAVAITMVQVLPFNFCKELGAIMICLGEAFAQLGYMQRGWAAFTMWTQACPNVFMTLTVLAKGFWVA